MYAENRFVDQIRETDFLEDDRQLTLFDPPQIENVLEGSLKGRTFVQSVAQTALGRIRNGLVLASQNRNDRFDDVVERRAKFARHLFNEVVLEFFDLAQLLVIAQQLDVLGE